MSMTSIKMTFKKEKTEILGEPPGISVLGNLCGNRVEMAKVLHSIKKHDIILMIGHVYNWIDIGRAVWNYKEMSFEIYNIVGKPLSKEMIHILTRKKYKNSRL